MIQYQNLIREVLATGEWQDNRTGIRTISVPGAMMRFDLTKGFPAITTKRLAFKSVVGELCAFLRGSRSAADFRALGCKVWDQNANENEQWLANPFRTGLDDLGPVYGVQWRAWPAYKEVTTLAEYDYLSDKGWTKHSSSGEWEGFKVTMTKKIDQLRDCVDTIVNNPENRRILFHAWNPAELDAVALPACHVLYQFFPRVASKTLSMSMYIRSNDIGLGTPFNVAEGAALLSLVARLTGYTAKHLTYFMGDAHIYENHMDMCAAVLAREPLPLPTLKFDGRVPDRLNGDAYAPEWLDLIEPSDFILDGYQSHPPIKAAMAV